MMGAIYQVRDWAQQPRIRFGLRVFGLTLLVFGAVWSITTLELDWRSLSLFDLLLNFLLLTPLNLVLAALSFLVTARAVGRDLSGAQSLQIVATANLAELLPLPGGALVRGAALVDAGASVADSTRIVILTSLLMLTMLLTFSATALALSVSPIWGVIAGASALGLLAVLVLLARRVAARHIFAMVGVRALTLVLTVIRLIFAFAALGAALQWLDAVVYSAAPTLGTAVAIVPAGFGISELIAAGLATLVAGSSATAFLAVALNRVLGLVVGATMVFVLSLLPGHKSG